MELFCENSQWMKDANSFCKQLHIKSIYRERICSVVQNQRKLWEMVGLVVVLQEHGEANLILYFVSFTSV